MQVIGTGVRIGKEGLKQGVIDEIKKQLRVKGFVRIKLLRSYISTNEEKGRKELFAEIAAKSGGEVVKAVGFVLVLRRPGVKLPSGLLGEAPVMPKRFINKRNH